MTNMTTKTLSIRLPHDLWVRLRRLQEEREIKSIQDAVIRGLELLTSNPTTPKED